jgi:glycosyltransferase involved in cell wall biosynthesis
LFRDGKPCRDCVGKSPWRGVQHRCYNDSAVSSAAAATTLSFNRTRGTWANGVDRFITPSRGLRDTVVAGGLPADRVVVRAHAVADVGPRVQPPSKASTALYAGRISHEKGLDVLLEAWARRRPPGIELVIAGDGPLRSGLESRAIEGVRFAGWLPPDEVRKLMLEARALLFPSVCFEVFPASIVEAMSAGLPVIASAHGGSAEIVSQLGSEWLAAPGDVQAWVERLEILADDAALDAAGARGKEIYAAQYAPAHGLASLVGIYRDAMETAGSR